MKIDNKTKLEQFLYTGDYSILNPRWDEKGKLKPIINENKIGRNDPCSCGSGKKYKICCMNKIPLTLEKVK